MRAMVLDRARRPLAERDVAAPAPGSLDVRLRVSACAVCRTDLHIVDGELADPKLPLILGHQIVGRVDAIGSAVRGLAVGDRVGVPWLGGTDGTCTYCRSGRENLCPNAIFTGYHRDGGYAELAIADSRYCLALPPEYDDLYAAPLLCAGLIGFRALRLAGDPRNVGLYGFGSSAHIVAQVATYEGRRVFAFTRPNDAQGQRFARSVGAAWAGGSDERPPELLDAAIIFAPVGALVPAALAVTAPGGVVVCAGIRMSDIPSFGYELLWQERAVRSVANLTRDDGRQFLALAPRIPVRVSAQAFALESANDAVRRIREGELEGSAVLRIG